MPIVIYRGGNEDTERLSDFLKAGQLGSESWGVNTGHSDSSVRIIPTSSCVKGKFGLRFRVLQVWVNHGQPGPNTVFLLGPWTM